MPDAFGSPAPIGADMPPWLTALLQQFANAEPTSAYNAQFGSMLQGRNQGLAKYVRGRQNDYYGDFLGQVLSNPMLQWTDYLRGKNPQQEFNALTPGQRGENPGLYAPRLKFLSSIFGA